MKIKIFKKSCDLWFCFKKQWRCVQISMGNDKDRIVSEIVSCYCERHVKIMDEMFKKGEIKTKVPIEEYEGL